MYYFDGAHGENVRAEEVPAELADEAVAARQRMLEALSMYSDGLMELLLAEEAVPAAMIREILDGVPGPPRDVVVANAAAALWTAGKAESVGECARLAAEAIDSSAAKHLLAQLVERTA